MLSIIRRSPNTVTARLWSIKVRMEGSSGWNCCTADVGTTQCSNTVIKNREYNNGNEFHCEYHCDEWCCRQRMYNYWKVDKEARWEDFNNRYGFSDGNIDNLHYPK